MHPPSPSLPIYHIYIYMIICMETPPKSHHDTENIGVFARIAVTRKERSPKKTNNHVSKPYKIKHSSYTEFQRFPIIPHRQNHIKYTVLPTQNTVVDGSPKTTRRATRPYMVFRETIYSDIIRQSRHLGRNRLDYHLTSPTKQTRMEP